MIYLIVIILAAAIFTGCSWLLRFRFNSHRWLKRIILAVISVCLVPLPLFLIGLFIDPGSLSAQCIAWHQTNMGELYPYSERLCQNAVAIGPQGRLALLLEMGPSSSANLGNYNQPVSEGAGGTVWLPYFASTFILTALFTLSMSSFIGRMAIWQKKAVDSGLVDRHAAYYAHLRNYLRPYRIAAWLVAALYALFALLTPPRLLAAPGTLVSSCVSLFFILVVIEGVGRGRHQSIWKHTESAAPDRRFVPPPPPRPKPDRAHGGAHFVPPSSMRRRGAPSPDTQRAPNEPDFAAFFATLSNAELQAFGQASTAQKMEIMRKAGFY